MQVLQKGLYLLVYLVYFTSNGNCQSSACGRFMKYYGSGGTLYIDPPSDSTVLDLSAEFTVAVHIKAKDFGELALVENSDSLLRRLQRNDASPVQYSVRFPINSPKPYLTTLTLNNVILCRETAQDPPLYTKLNLHYKWFSDVPVILKKTNYQEANQPQQYQPQQQQNLYNRPTYYAPPVTQAPFTCPPPPPQQKCYCPAAIQPTCPPPPRCYCPEPTRATCPPQEPPQRCYCPAAAKQTCPPPPPPQRCSCPAPPPPPPVAPCKNTVKEDTDSWKYKLCGESPVQPTNLVYDGKTTAQGRYPWVTAIYHVSNQGINFQCGGTLVTAKHVVTAAHCVVNETSTQVITDRVVIFLDRYEVLRFNDNALAPQIARIKIHPDYSAASKITDLAIITFKEAVKFGPFIKPICLWNTAKENTEYYNSGQIVGWGRNDYGEISNKPKEAEMSILQNKECRKYSGVEDILTESSFCAKRAESERGGSPCNGDSGGGLYIRSKQGGRWYLRGVVSKALVDNNKRCFPEKPAAFTDVSREDVLEWMQWTMQRDGANPLPDK